MAILGLCKCCGAEDVMSIEGQQRHHDFISGTCENGGYTAIKVCMRVSELWKELHSYTTS